MESFDDLKLERYINKALLEKSLGRPEMYDGLLEIAKAQQGVYVNNAVNRKLGIVGLPYKKRKATEEEKADLTKKTFIRKVVRGSETDRLKCITK